jgi:hypothetical protein
LAVPPTSYAVLQNIFIPLKPKNGGGRIDRQRKRYSYGARQGRSIKRYLSGHRCPSEQDGCQNCRGGAQIARAGSAKKRELLRYKRSVRLLSGIYRTRATDLELVLAVSAVPLVDSILSLLRSEKNPALLKTDRAFEKRLIFLMHQTAAKYNLTGQVAEEYGMLAARVSNRIAKYPKYSAYGEPTLRLRFMLPILVDHLIAEVQLSIDSGFKTPELNLINSSVFHTGKIGGIVQTPK